jgi:tRNA(adenine34) deaminase
MDIKSDQRYLRRCSELAKLAKQRGDAPVGALIVNREVVLSEASEAAFSKNDVTCHAEIEAIRAALKDKDGNELEGAVLYTSHEPCIMCSYAIRYYKLKKVVFQYFVPNLGGVSSSMPMLISKEVPKSWGGVPEIIHCP